MSHRRNHVYSPETLERRDCPAGFTLTPFNQVVSEGDSADFLLTLDAISPVPESVIVTSKSGTAIIGSDFMQRTERITFFPGETTKSFSVPTLRDPVESIEGAENFTVIVKPIGGTPSEITSLVVINDYVPPDDFQIDFVFNSDVPESLVIASGLAANLWQSVIIGNLSSVGDIDDIQINVQLGLLSGDSDQDGNTLAQARPIAFRTDSNGLPYLAEIGVDEADVDNPQLSTIMAHEIGHCLGFPDSNGWRKNVIPLGSATPTNFTGARAVEKYNLLFGTAADPSGVPLEQDGTEGTAFSHWDDATFGNELMTGNLDLTSTNPLSVITVGAFEDMGYDVNLNAAQPYTPPTTTVTTVGAGISNALGSGISNVVATSPSVIPPPVAPPPATAPRGRVLPARITFPDKPAIILSENNSSRQMVRSALQNNIGISLNGPFSLHHLSTNQRAILAAWASIGQETSMSLSSNLTSVGAGPKPSLFANEIFDFRSHGDDA